MFASAFAFNAGELSQHRLRNAAAILHVATLAASRTRAERRTRRD
jgi:hypothetical protein